MGGQKRELPLEEESSIGAREGGGHGVGQDVPGLWDLTRALRGIRGGGPPSIVEVRTKFRGGSRLFREGGEDPLLHSKESCA